MNEYPRNNHPNDPRNNPHEEQSPTWRALDGLSRYEPDAKDATRALDKAKLLLEQSQRGSQNVPRSRRWLMRISAAAAMVLVVMFIWMAIGPEGGLTNPTWADVLKQTKDVRVAKLDVRSYQGKTLESRQEMYLQAPSTLRLHEYEYEDGKEVETEGAIVTPEGGVRWNASSGVAEHVEPDNAYVAPASSAKTILGLLGMTVQMDTPGAKIDINQTPVSFEPVNYKHPIDPDLRGYQLKPVDPEQNFGVPMLKALTFWFDKESNTLQRMTAAGSEQGYAGEWYDATVEFEPVLPTDWFDVKAPEGYVNVSDGLRARLPEDVRDVYDKAAAARETFGDYRALIWSRQQGWGLPIYVESRKGEQWRADELQWTSNAFQAFAEARDIEPGDVMSEAWSAMTGSGFKLQSSAIKFGDRYAMVNYGSGGRGPRISAQLQPTLLSAGYDNFWGQVLRVIAWPHWMDEENLHPHGRSIREPLLQWRLLPQDEAHPDWIDVIAERDTNSRNYVRYTFDAAHDHLCIRREEREYGDRIEGWLVLGLAQTIEGKWYPKQVAKYTRTSDDPLPHASELEPRFTYLVGPGAAAGSFFDWPEGVPQPANPYAALQSRRVSTEEQASKTIALPPTAVGKYTYTATNGRGLPRGFDDEATSQAHWQMTRVMRDIENAVDKYKPDHNWNHPQTLDELIEGGYITREAMQNPLHPDADPPFVYIHIARNLPNGIGRVMLHEPFDTWPGVVTVMFGDGSFEAIHDEGEFNELIEAATSPEDPKRYGE